MDSSFVLFRVHVLTIVRPDRFGAQSEAAHLIFNAKTGANPESEVGLMSMGGKGPEVLVTLTAEFGKILAGLHQTKIKGSSHLASGISVAAVRRRIYYCEFVLMG
jgi:26S proteasome regulatory subunit N10